MDFPIYIIVVSPFSLKFIYGNRIARDGTLFCGVTSGTILLPIKKDTRLIWVNGSYDSDLKRFRKEGERIHLIFLPATYFCIILCVLLENTLFSFV